MIKTFLIGLKDLRLVFRDRAALVLMLLAPFLLTLGLGLVTGRFSGSGDGGLENIPVVIVNQDQAQLGNALQDLFSSQNLAGLVEPSSASDAQSARQLVDEDKTAAAVIIPAGFTRSIIPQQGDFSGPAPLATDVVQIEIYANSARPTSASVIQTIVDEFLSRVEQGRTAGMTSILQMLDSGRLQPSQAEAAGLALGQRLESGAGTETPAIGLQVSSQGAAAVDFDPLAFIAPGMALMFLMYTVSHGGRSILAERAQGTLPRILVSPTRPVQILGGKVFGIFLTGVAQMLILILASFLFFQLKWGDPLGVLVLILAAVTGATGWGMFITALARTPGQVASVGSAIMLIFGILGGSFISLDQMPPFVQALSRITPNAWALDAFTTLGLGGRLPDIAGPILALLAMGAILFTVSVLLFGKKNLVQP